MELSPKIVTLTREYFLIVLAGIPFVISYNFVFSFIKARGNSKLPLFFIFISTAINIVLNYILVLIFNLEIRGIALSTVVSQLFAALVSFLYFFKINKEKKVISDKTARNLNTLEIIKTITQLGSTSIIQNMTSSLSSIYMQKVINGYGVIVISSMAAASKIESFLIIPAVALGTSVSVFISQNYENKNFERMEKGFNFSVKISLYLNIVILIFILLFGKLNLKFILLENYKAVNLGYRYLIILSIFYFPLSMLYVLTNFLRAVGKIKKPIQNTFLELFSRIFFITLLPVFLGVNGVLLSRPLSFLVSCGNLYIFLLKNDRSIDEKEYE